MNEEEKLLNELQNNLLEVSKNLEEQLKLNVIVEMKKLSDMINLNPEK